MISSASIECKYSDMDYLGNYHKRYFFSMSYITGGSSGAREMPAHFVVGASRAPA